MWPTQPMLTPPYYDAVYRPKTRAAMTSCRRRYVSQAGAPPHRTVCVRTEGPGGEICGGREAGFCHERLSGRLGRRALPAPGRSRLSRGVARSAALSECEWTVDIAEFEQCQR